MSASSLFQWRPEYKFMNTYIKYDVTAPVLWVYFVLFSFTYSGDTRILLLLRVSVWVAHLRLLAT